MSPINVTIIPAFDDNYIYLLQADNDQTAIVDPGEAAPVITALDKHALSLDYILITHHHGDHTGGAIELKEKYNAQIIGPAADEQRISGLDIKLHDQEHFTFGEEEGKALETPGHTTGSMCFYFPKSKLIFTGDTLFSMGCGRLFEGTSEQMWSSLQKILALPDETKLYCAHEYTINNGTFCLSVEPDNKDLKDRMDEVKSLRAQNHPTLPSTIGLEKATNVFLRSTSPAHFAELRALKDRS